ncbi:MAG: cytochrome c oxidase assembly protein [Rhodospirillaceae bacterium]|nr:cytochrome c oxidase assembly protein [Rhodospirillaceae bacterium]
MRGSGKVRTLLGIGLLLGLMTGLTVYSVTLYELFCSVTGYGGTTKRAESSPDKILNRKITVFFNADTNSGLDWNFKPVQRKVNLRVGEKGLAFYEARSTSSKSVTGTATFNVTPMKAGQYFVKIDCFCFTEQTLEPGQTVNMPVQFYVDPKIANDRNLDEVDTITLSYTFFRSAEQKSVDRSKPKFVGTKNGFSSHLGERRAFN